jgi:hypothetical protein
MSENQGLDLEVKEIDAMEVDHQELTQNYEQLKKIGAQKIHEQTHIPKRQSEDLVSGNFESMNKIQFTGFISILEREYSIDLSALKAEGLNSFKDNTQQTEEVESKVFVTPKKAKNYKSVYIIAAVLIFIFVIIQLSSENESIEPKIDDKNIEKVASKIAPKDENLDSNNSVEKDIVNDKNQVSKKQELEKVSELKIIPNAKLWVGYIDISTGKKYQKIIPSYEGLELEPSTHWLLSLGHGDVKIVVDGQERDFKEPKNIRLEYKDGELKKITYREFLVLNKGKEW